MSFIDYDRTVLTDSPLARMSPLARKRLIMGLWTVTWPMLAAGFIDPIWWTVAIAFSALHALLFVGLVGGNPWAFPAQLRIAYVAFLAIGTYVPGMVWMMPVTTVGLGANLLFGYCPLARLLYLLPWNRRIALDGRVFLATFFTPPRPGRFEVPAAA